MSKRFINLETFRTEATEWKHFAQIALFVLSLSLATVVLACEFLCWKTGELILDQSAANRQMVDPSLIWFAHHDVDAVQFKLIRVNQIRPDILVMGQSRAAQFRAGMFAPYSFYNLGRVSWPISTLTMVLEHLPAGYAPKIIIFNLDFFMFSPRYGSSHLNATPRFAVSFWKRHLDSLRDAFTDLNADPLILFLRSRTSRVGLQANLTHHGFRQDGSEVWPTRMEEAAGRDPNLLEHARWNDEPLEYGGDLMTPEGKGDLESFARLARSRGIKLVGIQMPMYDLVVKAIEQSPQYGVLKDFRAHLASAYFQRLGIITFDFLDFPPYSSDYRYFGDAVHPTEALSAALLLKIDQDPRVQAILPKLDTAALRQKLEEDRKANQHVYLY